MSLDLLGVPKPSGTLLPLFTSTVAAGFPSPAEDHIEASLSLDELCIRHPASTFFLRVSGDSMTGLGIFDGDVLVVDRSLTPQPGMVVVAIVSGSFTCKRLDLEGGLPVLRAANPSYPDIRLGEGEELEVFGVVSHCIHKLPVF